MDTVSLVVRWFAASPFLLLGISIRSVGLWLICLGCLIGGGRKFLEETRGDMF